MLFNLDEYSVTSPDTLIQRIRQTQLPTPPAPKVIGVDVVERASYRYQQKRHIIAEISPRWQAKLGKDLSDVRTEIRGKWVRMTGWLMYDRMHASESWNTRKPGATIWRRTAREIHPVTSYEALDGPPQ